jgi:hypothetical protein
VLDCVSKTSGSIPSLWLLQRESGVDCSDNEIGIEPDEFVSGWLLVVFDGGSADGCVVGD